MPIPGDNWAPYAAPTNVLLVLRRLRERGVPERVTPELLEQFGMNSQGAGRVRATLEFLGLTEDDGTSTDLFRALHQATSPEYAGVLSDIVRSAYSRVFQAVDPATATDVEIKDAFRVFKPASQTGRMGTLFRALAQESGLIEGDPRIIRRQRAAPATPAGGRATQPTRQQDQTAQRIVPQREQPQRQLSPMLKGFFDGLPPKGTVMSEAERENLATIFKTMLAVDYPAGSIGKEEKAN